MAEWGMVIVGAGEAGARAAVELRVQGWSGSITMIGEEKWAPYERPPLSKRQLLSDDEHSPVYIHDNDIFARHDIRLLPGNPAASIDRSNHRVVLADGTQIGYERLLLTTGARPRRLSGIGSAIPNLLYLRTFADSLALRNRLVAGKRIAVIGGGFIGLEVTASSVDRGCSVTLIEVGPRILTRGVPVEIAEMIQARHRTAGVEFKTGTGIDSLKETDHGFEIVPADKTVIRCDEVVVGIGAVPETSLAAECGLEIENGVRADERLATSDSDIFAAGDCCSFPHQLYEGKRIRLEAWRNAQDQGIHAAQSMLGSADPFTTVPWFWSDQYEQTLQVAGLPDSGESTVIRDLGETGRLFFHLSGEGRLMGVSGIGLSSGIAKDIRVGEMLIARKAKPDIHQLTNPNVKMKSFL